MSKRFWSFIKSMKKEASGVSPLISEGHLVSDPATKANVLNRQYQSVFTTEDNSTIPDKGPSPHTTMPDINICNRGVEKLLKDLNLTSIQRVSK